MNKQIIRGSMGKSVLALAGLVNLVSGGCEREEAEQKPSQSEHAVLQFKQLESAIKPGQGESPRVEGETYTPYTEDSQIEYRLNLQGPGLIAGFVERNVLIGNGELTNGTFKIYDVERGGRKTGRRIAEINYHPPQVFDFGAESVFTRSLEIGELSLQGDKEGRVVGYSVKGRYIADANGKPFSTPRHTTFAGSMPLNLQERGLTDDKINERSDLTYREDYREVSNVDFMAERSRRIRKSLIREYMGLNEEFDKCMRGAVFPQVERADNK